MTRQQLCCDKLLLGLPIGYLLCTGKVVQSNHPTFVTKLLRDGHFPVIPQRHCLPAVEDAAPNIYYVGDLKMILRTGTVQRAWLLAVAGQVFSRLRRWRRHQYFASDLRQLRR